MKLERVIPPPEATSHTKYIVTLTDEERTALHAVTRTGRTAARTVQHAWILLKADASGRGPRWTDEQISEAFEVSIATIFRVRRAFVEDGLDAALQRRTRTTPRPRKVDGAQEAHLIALLCSAVPEGHDRWTLRLLADKFVELEGSVDISHETVRRVLEKKRTEAVAQGAVVHPTGGKRSVRVPHGRRAGCVRPSV